MCSSASSSFPSSSPFTIYATRKAALLALQLFLGKRTAMS